MQVSETYIPLQPHELLTQIIKALREAGMTILISSHVLSDLAELCTSVGIMELGYLVESASLEELYRRLGHSSIFMSTLGNLEALISELKNHPWVEDWEILPETQQKVRVHFSGSSENCVMVLR